MTTDRQTDIHNEHIVSLAATILLIVQDVPQVTIDVCEDMMYAPLMNFDQIPEQSGLYISLEGYIRKVIQ